MSLSAAVANNYTFYAQMGNLQSAIGLKFAESYPDSHSRGMETHIDVGDRLNELMQNHPLYRGRGQSALGRDTGVPQSTINRILSNTSVPEMATVIKLALRFGVTCEWLLTGRGPKNPTELNETPQRTYDLHSGFPVDVNLQEFPIDVTKALQAALTAFRTGGDIRSSDLRTIIWYALTPVESGNMALSNEGPAPQEHEQALEDRAAAAIKRMGNEHVAREKGTKKRHQS